MRAARGRRGAAPAVRVQNANARAGASRDAPHCRRGKIARKTVRGLLSRLGLAFRFADDRGSTPRALRQWRGRRWWIKIDVVRCVRNLFQEKEREFQHYKTQ